MTGARIALLGLAFKAGTDDVRDSPALALAAEARAIGAAVVGYDPRAAGAACHADVDLEVADTPLDAAHGADAMIVATEWPEFRAIDWIAIRAGMRGDLVYDTRNIVDVAAARAAGLRVEVLGRRR
jgi:UDPglucose 6-dehydrogenase